ncbi:hypothetical protein ACXDTG_002476 [Klebsiella pneumoniae]
MSGQELKNTLWMSIEKSISIISFFLVTAYVYKYIGPKVAGHLTYYVSIYQLVVVVSRWGGDSLISKRLGRNYVSAMIIIKAMLPIRAFIFLMLSIPIEIFICVTTESLFFILSCGVAISSFISSIDVYSTFNNAMLISKNNVIANSIGIFVNVIIRFFIVFFSWGVQYFFIPIVMYALIPFLFKRDKYRQNAALRDVNEKHKRRHGRYNKYLIGAGFSLMLSSLSVVMYSQCQNIVIYHLLSGAELGIYSAATMLGTGGGVIINSLITSSYTSIFAEKKEKVAFEKTVVLLRYVLIISVLFCFVLFFFAEHLILKMYGIDFILAKTPMIILSCSALVSFLGTVTYRYIVNYSGYPYLAVKSAIVLIISVPLTWLSVKHYGLNGAAFSNFLIELMSLTIMNYFFRKKSVKKLHFSALNLR